MPVPTIEYNIYDLDPLPNAADLVNKYVEVADAAGRNNRVDVPTLLQAAANAVPGGNSGKSHYKLARSYDTTDPTYQPGMPTLVTLDPNFLAGGALCWVEAERREYRLVYDPNGPVTAFVSGDLTGQKQTYRWMVRKEADSLLGATLDFSPFKSPGYTQGGLIKYKYNGTNRLYTARKDLVKGSFSNNLVPAPTGTYDNDNWIEVSAYPEETPNNSTSGQISCRYRYNAESLADPYGGDTLEAVTLRNNCLYVGRTATVELGLNAGTYRVAEKDANPDFLAFADGNFSGKTGCKWILVEEAKPAVIPWVAGPQKANSLVRYNDNVYLVKNDIANGQTVPEGNTQYYFYFADGTAMQAALKEIADQLAADEQGAAAILATQQQHTQQLVNVVHRTGDETVAGAKTFTDGLTVNVGNNTVSINGGLANMTPTLAIINRDPSGRATGLLAGTGGSAFSFDSGGAFYITTESKAAFSNNTLGGGPVLMGVQPSGEVGIATGTRKPTATLEVGGSIKANVFIGDGAQLTNLPTTPVEQNLTANSTTAAPSVAAVVASYRNNLTATTRDANQALDARQGKVLDDKIAAVNNNIRPTVAITDPFAQITFQQGYYYVYNDILWLRTGATVSDNASNMLYVGSPGWKDTLGYNIYDGLISYGDRSLSNDSRWVKYQVGVSNQRAIKGQIWYLNGNAYRYINNASSTGIAQAISGPDEFANQTLWENVIGGGVVPQNLKNIVRTGTFINGELQGPQPQNSVSNAKFTDANYKYEYTYAAADTNGTQFVWVRTQKA